MSGKYVPPSKRAGYVPAKTELPPGYRPQRSVDRTDNDPQHHHTVIERVFDTHQQGTFNYFEFIPPPLPPQPGASYDPYGPPHTIPLPPSPPPGATVPHPLGHLVAYVIRFGGAHPFWETNAELWSHTDAEKLIQDESSGQKKNFGRPIPVFSAPARRIAFLEFDGWWYVEFSCLAPSSRIGVD